MNLPKAIEILDNLFGLGPYFPPDDRRAAVKLSIEALKREMLFRERVPKKEWSLLPGETKD